eukprot:16443653-Heterocapsa_arctica.AAC.1
MMCKTFGLRWTPRTYCTPTSYVSYHVACVEKSMAVLAGVFHVSRTYANPRERHTRQRAARVRSAHLRQHWEPEVPPLTSSYARL